MLLINLSKTVSDFDICRITAGGNNFVEIGHIKITMSPNAVLGFATELSWLYKDACKGEKTIITTYPLRADMAPNQAVGFYLTSESPILVLKLNSLDKSYDLKSCFANNFEIKWKNANQFYNIEDYPKSMELEYDGKFCLESYELGRRNIADIRIYDINGEDVTAGFSSVTVELNYEGIKKLVSMLLVWLNGCDYEKEYGLSKIDDDKTGCNFGVILTKDSVPTMLKCSDLGTFNNYIETNEQ